MLFKQYQLVSNYYSSIELSHLMHTGNTTKRKRKENHTTDEPPAKRTKIPSDQIPSQFICPISKQIMEDPVITTGGNVYERAEIEKWFERSNTDPVTNIKVEKRLFSVRSLKDMIDKFIEENPGLKSEQYQTDFSYDANINNIVQHINDGTHHKLKNYHNYLLTDDVPSVLTRNDTIKLIVLIAKKHVPDDIFAHIVEHSLDHAAEFTVFNKQSTPIKYTTTGRGYPKTLRAFMKKGVQLDQELFFKACNTGNDELIQIFIDANISFHTTPINNNFNNDNLEHGFFLALSCCSAKTLFKVIKHFFKPLIDVVEDYKNKTLVDEIICNNIKYVTCSMYLERIICNNLKINPINRSGLIIVINYLTDVLLLKIQGCEFESVLDNTWHVDMDWPELEPKKLLGQHYAE